MKTRRKITAQFKAQVALEAIKEQLTAAEITRKFQVHPNQISKLKREFIEHAHKAFGDSDKAGKAREETESRLYEQIGRLQTEVTFLKKLL